MFLQKRFPIVKNDRLQSLCSVRGKRIQLRHWRTPKVNACYVWWANSIFVSDGLLKCPEGEIIAALLHELGHVVYRHGPKSALIPLTGGILMFATGALLHFLSAPWFVFGIVMSLFFVLIPYVMGRASRGMVLYFELQADDFAIQVLGDDKSLNAVLERAKSKRRMK